MKKFLTGYLWYVLLIMMNILLSAVYFTQKNWFLASIWGISAVIWSVRLYQEHQKHRNKK